MPKKLMIDCTEDELRVKLQQAMKFLENHLPAGDGPDGKPFIVLLTGTFAAGVAQYASNGQRDGVVKFLRESADRLERGEDVPRTGTPRL